MCAGLYGHPVLCFYLHVAIDWKVENLVLHIWLLIIRLKTVR